MKKLISSKYFQIGLTAFLVIAAGALFWFILQRVSVIWTFFKTIISILMPLIVGLILAYIMNPIVCFFEQKVFNMIEKKTIKRNISITVTLVIIISLLATLISIIIPQLLESIQLLVINIPTYLKNIGDFIMDFVKENNLEESILSNYDNITKNVLDVVNTIVIPSDVSGAVTSGISGAFRFVFNLVIGTVFAIYILANLTKFKAQLRKFLYSIFDVNKINSISDELNHINSIFLHFMGGKIICSTMVAIITFIFLVIFKFPYPLLIATIIGVTDLIPYFGPYIGTIPSALLILMVSPVKAITFIIFILVMQQIDGNIITPRVQKEATGLPSFWVLLSITLFGGLFGVVGLLLAVPCFTIIYELVTDCINKKLIKKKLPQDTSYYEQHKDLPEIKIKKSRKVIK